jgi:hypothetical protein
MNNAERWLKIVLWLFGAPCLLALVAVVMPRGWMAVTHEWLGMGTLPDKPIVEYLARTTSGLFFLYGWLLLLFASDVHRYARAITLQAIIVIGLSGVGAVLGFRAGMPLWWMIGDIGSCWLCCGAILWLQKRIPAVKSAAGQPQPLRSVA